MATTFNSTLSQSLGKLLSWNKHGHGLSGETSFGKFTVSCYNDSIVRIHITKAENFDEFSYAVIVRPTSADLNIIDTNDSLIIKTKKLIVTIQKDPVRFSFADSNNHVINEDDTFGTSWNGDQVTTYKKMQEGERFIGLGEKTGPLDRRGHGYQNWNTDTFAYSSGSDPLYCTTPFYIGIHHGLHYGIFFDNSHKSFFNFGASNNRFSSFYADAGDMNYYFIAGDSLPEIIQHYTHLTGRMEMPPLWSIGYQQCRYSYYPDKEVISLAQTFREKDIPSDAIVFDIHYMDKYKIFTWSKKDFPDPRALLSRLKSMGFQVVVMCDPGIKVEDGYATYEDGIKQNVFIKYPDGTNYTGQVWPGWCHFPDFTKPATRAWWKEQFHSYIDLGVEGFWNDMNEIATWGNMIPENIEMDFEGNVTTMRRGRNVYGMQMARSTYEGTKSLLNGRRPFNLTRSGYSGVQRYAAVWTGDNVAYDEHMLLGVRMVSSMGLAGIPFAGYDTGGFVGDANTKLFARWISIATFSPFFRGHSMINSRDSEPWSYGEEVEQISRNYIKFRYKILPYIYALFYEASQTGMPLQRSLAINYPHEPRVYDGQFFNQYLFGPFMLIAPVESAKDFTKVFLPEGYWYSLYNGKKYEGNTEVIVECPTHKLPVFIKEGAIIPMQPVKSSTAELTDVLIIHVYAGHATTSFIYYEDDGTTFDYQQNKFARRVLELSPRSFTMHAVEGSYQTPIKKLKIVFHALENSPTVVNVNGHDQTLKHEVNRFFDALEKFDPIYDPEPAPEENVISLELNYLAEKIVLKW